jgi:hypothetical protein
MNWKIIIDTTRDLLGGGVNALLKLSHVHKPVTHPLHILYHRARMGIDVSGEVASLPDELRHGVSADDPIGSIDCLVEAIMLDLSDEAREAVYAELARVTPEDREADTEHLLMALNNRCILPGHGNCIMGLDNALTNQPHRYILQDRSEPIRLRFGYVNGIARPFKMAEEDAIRLSNEVLDGKALHGVHNSSNGGLIDFGQAFVHHNDRCFKASALLQQEWREYLSTTEGTYIQLCHSDGASCTYHALHSLEKEYRDRIIVIAIAPATFIPEGYCKAAYHIANEKDPVVQLSIQRSKADQEKIVSIAGPTKGHNPHNPFDPQKMNAIKEILADLV